jgi:hypothetical protein
MPVFRFHRGSLNESMQTCVVVKNKEDLFNYISSFNKATGKLREKSDRFCISSSIRDIDQLKILPYIFDTRIGWNTHLVLIHNTCVTQDAYPIGFLSDAL